jgi:hypothetical protein
MDEELEALAGALDEASGRGVQEIDSIHSAVADYRDKDEPSPEDQESLLERLRHGVDRLEATHPDLSSAIARVIDSLTAFGL